MKKQLKSILIFTGIIVLCCLIMIGSSYLYLEISLNSAEADTNESNIPYASPLPDNVGLLWILPENNGYMIFLNFKNDNITISKIDKVEEEKEEYFGYPVSYTFKVKDYRFFANIIDRIGGIEIFYSNENLRYTGTQIIEKIENSTNKKELVREVIRKYFYEISQNGFSKDDILYIIENTETDLTVPDSYYWPPYIAEIAQNLQFIN